MPDAWYPPAAEYFVPPEEDHRYPVRQGDIFGSPPEVEAGTDPWLGSVVVHPSCELHKAKPEELQVARIHALSELTDDFQKTAVTFGFSESDGVVRIAFANTFWLPPAGSSGSLSQPTFVDFRQIINVAREHLAPDRRVRAMTHEARVYFIRRKIYFRYRWNLPVEDVRQMESRRIAGDRAFQGPKPGWATD